MDRKLGDIFGHCFAVLYLKYVVKADAFTNKTPICSY